MPVIDIDNVLGKPANRIYRVGVELEGGWVTAPTDITMHRDGSVQIKPPVGPDGGYVSLTLGEVHSEPIEPIRLRAWMKRAYPSHVNASCGLHVHMSFRSARYYQWLMDSPDYQETIVEYLARWGKKQEIPKRHPLWTRLRGENEFCKLEFYPDVQASQKSKNYSHNGRGSRYTAINYCYGQHETVECRVLPMFDDHETAYSAVRQVLDVTNAYLTRVAGREEKVDSTVTADKSGCDQQEWVTYA